MARFSLPVPSDPPCDHIDAALLLAVLDGAREPATVLDAVRGLSAPWIHPTAEVIGGRLARQREAGGVSCGEDGLSLTPRGRETLRAFALSHDATGLAHHLLELGESIRLALAGALEQEDRDTVHDALVAARSRCLAAQRERLRAQGSGALTARSLAHGVALAETRLAAVQSLAPRPPLARKATG